MKRLASTLVVLCVVLILIAPAAAATDQGLEWGFAAGDRFDFHFRYTDFVNPIFSTVFDFYFEVSSLPPISDNITEVAIPYFDAGISSSLDFLFTNGTSMGATAAILPGLLLPIGNWTLWTTLYEGAERHEGVDYHYIDASESDITWSYSDSSGGEGMAKEDGTAEYLKEDGVLTNFHWIVHDENGNSVFEYEISRFGYEPLSPLLLIGVGGAVLVAVVVLIVFVKKR